MISDIVEALILSAARNLLFSYPRSSAHSSAIEPALTLLYGHHLQEQSNAN